MFLGQGLSLQVNFAGGGSIGSKEHFLESTHLTESGMAAIKRSNAEAYSIKHLIKNLSIFFYTEK